MLVDSSCFVNFADAGKLLDLLRYLKVCKEVRILQEVDDEVGRRAGLRRRDGDPVHPGLSWWGSLRDRPDRVEVAPGFVCEATDIVRALQQPGDHPKKHAGEAATIVKAMETRALTVLDDREAKGFARARGVRFVSTTQLVAQMVVDRAIGSEDGLAVYRQAAPELLDGAPFPAREFFRGELRQALRAFKEEGLIPVPASGR